MDASPSQVDRILASLGAPRAQAGLETAYLSPTLRSAASYLDTFEALETALGAAYEIYDLGRVEGCSSGGVINAGERAPVISGNSEHERRVRVNDLGWALEQTRKYSALFHSVLEASLGPFPDPQRGQAAAGRASALVFEGPGERVESVLLTCAHIVGEAERTDVYAEAIAFLRDHDELLTSDTRFGLFIPAPGDCLAGLAAAIERDLAQSR